MTCWAERVIASDEEQTESRTLQASQVDNEGSGARISPLHVVDHKEHASACGEGRHHPGESFEEGQTGPQVSGGALVSAARRAGQGRWRCCHRRKRGGGPPPWADTDTASPTKQLPHSTHAPSSAASATSRAAKTVLPAPASPRMRQTWRPAAGFNRHTSSSWLNSAGRSMYTSGSEALNARSVRRNVGDSWRGGVAVSSCRRISSSSS